MSLDHLDYLTEPMLSKIHSLSRELARVRTAAMHEDTELSQILGRALGYPRYMDDQKTFPGCRLMIRITTGCRWRCRRMPRSIYNLSVRQPSVTRVANMKCMILNSGLRHVAKQED